MAIPIAARRKVMYAAAEVQTDTRREAAIVGGISRSVIDSGTMRPDMVRAWLTSAMGLTPAERQAPCKAELAQIVARFEEAFGRRVA